MKNHATSSLKNLFSHPGEMVCRAPKLAQFGPNLKLWRICQNCESLGISRGSAQFLAKFQFWSFSFVPNCPNWPQRLIFKGLTSLAVFRKKTPSPYGRECPYGGNSPQSRVLWVLISSFSTTHFPTTKQEVSNG